MKNQRQSIKPEKGLLRKKHQRKRTLFRCSVLTTPKVADVRKEPDNVRVANQDNDHKEPDNAHKGPDNARLVKQDSVRKVMDNVR